jgi:RHH-type proline utilization regulon transcriptional repressor/proline dehydrogenase/delta 1-pyrroline-5-carboxylate dehydrogenase
MKRAQPRGLAVQFDMLGEGARTAADAERYEKLYAEAIEAVGKNRSRWAIPEGRKPATASRSSCRPCRRAMRRRTRARLGRALSPHSAPGPRSPRGMTQLHHRRRRGRPPGPVAEAARPAGGEESLGGLDGPGPGGPGLSEALPRGHRRFAESPASLRPAADGAAWSRAPTGTPRSSAPRLWAAPTIRSSPPRPRPTSTICVCAKLIAAAPDLYAQFATHNAHSLAAVHEMAGAGRGQDRIPAPARHGRGPLRRRRKAFGPRSRCGPMPRSAGMRTCCPIWCAACSRTGPTPPSFTPCWTSGCPPRRSPPIPWISSRPTPTPIPVFKGPSTCTATVRTRLAATIRAPPTASFTPWPSTAGRERFSSGPIVGGALMAGSERAGGDQSLRIRLRVLGQVSEITEKEIDRAIDKAATAQSPGTARAAPVAPRSCGPWAMRWKPTWIGWSPCSAARPARP